MTPSGVAPADRRRKRRFRRFRYLILFPLGFLVISLPLLALERFTREPESATYSLIEDGLYVGGAVRRPPPGVRAVVNLCEQPDPYRCEVHVWEPIRDGKPAPDLEWLGRMVHVVDDQRRAGLPTYVHCMAGVSRSAMLVTAYEMYKNHWTRDEALAFVRSKRPEVRPNPAFMDRLAEWESMVTRPPTDAQAGNRP